MTLPPEMTLRDWFAGQVLSRAIDLAADVNHTEMRARFGDDYLATSKVSIAAARRTRSLTRCSNGGLTWIANMLPDAKWAVDALKLPAKVTGGIFLATIVLLLLSAFGIMPLAAFGFLAAPIVIVVTVVSGCLTLTALLAVIYDRYVDHEKAGALQQRRKLRATEHLQARADHDAAVAARIDYFSAKEIAVVAQQLRTGEQSFEAYFHSPTVANLRAKGFVGTPGGQYHQDHYPFFFTDGAWKALLASKDELIAKDDENRRRAKAEEDAAARRRRY